MTKYKQNFEKCVSKIQKTQDAYKFRRKITEITLSINSRVRLWKINHSGRGRIEPRVKDVVLMNFTSGILSSKTLVSIFPTVKPALLLLFYISNYC